MINMQGISDILVSSEVNESPITTEFGDVYEENTEICNITRAKPR